METSFKKFYDKSTNRKNHDKTIVDKLLQIAQEIYSQNTSYRPEDLALMSRDQYMNSEIDRIKLMIDNSFEYFVGELQQKFPQKEINNVNKEEDSKNEKE